MQGARSFPQFALRMNQELKSWLAQQASNNLRSLNAEIVNRLEESRKNEEAGKERDAHANAPPA